MVLFSYGGLINPHVMGNQLSHFAPMQIKPETELQDVLNQCIIFLEPCLDYHKERTNLLYSMGVNLGTLDKILAEQFENRMNELPM
jgi:hypothetical protein